MRKILIISDTPTTPSGLGRITREIATNIATKMSEDFIVETIGCGATSSRLLPFHQHPVNVENWMIPELPKVWRELEGTREDVILTIWDLSRLNWLVDPDFCPDGELKSFVAARPFQLWSYLPIDAESPGGKLSFGLAKVAERFDRLLAYTEWAAKVVDRSIPRIPRTEWLPHGIDTETFKSIEGGREMFGKILNLPLPPSTLLMGVVATNQARKDWGLAFDVLSRLLRQGVDAKLWCHTDVFNRAWDFGALQRDLGIPDGAIIPTRGVMTDEMMAIAYSACDVTLAPGLGEGWGWPIAESLACGTPVIHGDYGGGAEYVPSYMKVKPAMFRMEGAFNMLRPLFNPDLWVEAVLANRNERAELPDYIDWKNAWPKWESWIRRGLPAREESE